MKIFPGKMGDRVHDTNFIYKTCYFSYFMVLKSLTVHLNRSFHILMVAKLQKKFLKWITNSCLKRVKTSHNLCVNELVQVILTAKKLSTSRVQYVRLCEFVSYVP